MSMMMEKLVNCNDKNGYLMVDGGDNKMRPSILGSGDRTAGKGFDHQPCSSSSSSSIGMNSDDESDVDDDDDEVESKLKNTSFDSAVQALEQALPIRRGISNFYAGKSKSFASLSDATRSSIKDITKPENAYSRKRKRLLAYSLLYDKDKTSMLKIPGIEGGITKRSTNTSSRTTLAFAVAMKNSGGHIDNSRIPSLSRPISHAPPPPWRSFSLADLQQCGVSINGLNSNPYSSLMGKRTKRDEVS